MMIIVLLMKFIYMLIDFKNLKDPKAFIEYSNNKQDIYKNIEEGKPSRKCNILIFFDDMIADKISNKNLVQY